MTPPLYETPAPPSSSIQVTFAFFVGTSENRIARLPRYPDSPNMALALHAARRPTLLFEFLDYPHQLLNFLFLESFVVQPQLRIGGSIGIQRDQSKAYLPLSTSKCHTRFAPLHLGRDSSGALQVLSPYTPAVSSRVPLRIPRDGGGTYLFPSTFSTTFGGFFCFGPFFVFRLTTLKPVRLVLFPSFLDGGHGRHHYQYQFDIDVPPDQDVRCVSDSSRIL